MTLLIIYFVVSLLSFIGMIVMFRKGKKLVLGKKQMFWCFIQIVNLIVLLFIAMELFNQIEEHE